MIVSEADSQTVEWFCFGLGLGLDFVFWLIPLSFLSNGSKQDSITVLFFALTFSWKPASFAPPVRKSGMGPVPRVGPATNPESLLALWEPWVLGEGLTGQDQDEAMKSYSFSGLVPTLWGLSRLPLSH